MSYIHFKRFLWLGLFLSAFRAEAANPTNGLRIEVMAVYNLVVDSNVETPATYAPRAAFFGAHFCNDGTNALTNVWAYIGNYTNGGVSTPGVYPQRQHPPLVGPLPGSNFALTHQGGSLGTADATRFLGTIKPGECKMVYWLVSYPNVDALGKAVWGPSIKPDDDLWLEYDIWATAQRAGSTIVADQTRTVTLRKEISAMANKIYPNTASKVPNEYQALLNQYMPSWTNSAYDGSPGTIIQTEGIWYDLGNVGAGFDNDGDLFPDRNVWLQPVGDPALFDPSCFRLVQTRTLLVIKLNTGENLVYTDTDKLYYMGIPENNRGAVGYVAYDFQVLKGGCASQLTPYQTVASGYDNEKFNGDYGAYLGWGLFSGETKLSFTKSAATPWIGPGETNTYYLSFTNTGTVAIGDPGAGTPLVIHEKIPHGGLYIPLSAYSSNTIPADVTNYIILFSTNNGASWLNYEPANPATITDIQWWLDSSLATGAIGQVSFKLSVTNNWTNNTPFLSNTGCVSIGSADPFACSETNVTVRGTNRLGDTVWADIGGGGGYVANGIQDGTEPGISNITVWLYFDANGNGVQDSGDWYYGSQVTGANGYYMFTNLPDGKFVAVVDWWDPDLPRGYTPTTPTTWAADLDSPRTNLAMVSFLTADYGFAPALTMTKDLIGTNVVYENRNIQYTLTVSNTLPGNGTSSGASCQYVTWATNQHWTQPKQANASWIALTNAWRPPWPDGKYCYTMLANSEESMVVSEFPMATQLGSVTNVKLIFPMLAPTQTAWISFNITLYAGGSSWVYSYSPGSLPTNGTLSIDVTTNRTWTWTNFSGTNVYVNVTAKKSGNTAIWVGIDTVGFLITSDQSCGGGADSNLVLNPVPLEDWFKTNELTFLSAQPSPTSYITNNPGPNATGVLYWANLGPLYPGGSRTVTLNFKVTESTNNIATWMTNFAWVTNAWFVSGKPANNATSWVPVQVLPSASIGDFVWRDINANGVQDGGNEVGIPNVAVVLVPPTNVDAGAGVGVRITNLTDSAGYYLFAGLPSTGLYTVIVLTNTLPSAFTNTFDWDGNRDSQTTVSNLNPYSTTGLDKIRYVDFGYWVLSTIEGTVWHDLNRNGASTPDPGEQWITNVTVYLYATNNLVTPIATNWTDVNGYFKFSGTYSGQYVVVVATNIGVMTNAVWYQSFDTDGTGTAHRVTVTVPLGGSARADYSYYKVGVFAVGDTVFYDWNGNGVQDAEDEGMPDITVWLYEDANSNGFIDVGTDALIMTTATASNGWYLFTGLPTSNYLVIVNHASPAFPTNYICTADPWGLKDGRSVVYLTATNLLQDFGYQPYGYGAIGDRVWYDADGDGIQDFGETGISNITVSLYWDPNKDGTYQYLTNRVTTTNGYYLFSNLPDANYRVTVDARDPDLPTNRYGNVSFPTTVTNYTVTISGGNTYLDADFGFVLPGAIGDTIFWDLNRNGTQDWNEQGISNVTVSLYRDTDGNRVYSAGDVLLAVTNTTTNGFYIFTGLMPTNYVVVVTDNSGPLANAMRMADPNNDGLSCLDPDKNEDCDGQYGTYLNYGQSFMGADFGYTPPGAIGDYVWVDTNGNGVPDAGEAPIPYITVSLYSNGTLVATTETEADGYYGFGNLYDGTYRVVVNTNDTDFPRGLVNTYVYNGTPNSTTTNIVISNGVTIAVGGLNCSDCNLSIDFGYRYVGTNLLSGTIGLDKQPFDGLMGTTGSGYSPGEAPFPGVTVFLYLWGDTNNNQVINPGEAIYIGSTLTITNGDYSFTGLPAGGGTNYFYVVAMAPPYDYLYMTTTNGSTTARSVTNVVNLSGYTVSARQVLDIQPVTTNIDFAFTFAFAYDWGDLPVSYGTQLQDIPIGPRHKVSVSTNLFLGATIDVENNGQPSLLADGDGADEDGVWTDGQWTTGVARIFVEVGSGSGWLVGYIDWNTNGTFADAGELVINQAVSTNGGNRISTNATFGVRTNVYMFDIAVDTNLLAKGTNATLYARFRLTANPPAFPALAFSGAASDGEVEDYRWLIKFTPTYIVLIRFEAVSTDGRAVLEWETASEVGTAGYQVSRRTGERGRWVRLTDGIIPALFEAPQGGVYRFTDSSAQAGQTYEYRLEEIELDGTVNPQEAIPVTLGPPARAMKTEAKADASTSPQVERTPRPLESFESEPESAESEPEPSARTTFAPRTLLRTAGESWPAVKVGVSSRGVQFVSAASVAAAIGAREADVLGRLASGEVRLTLKGRPVALRPAATGFTFYGEPAQGLYTDVNVYWLTWEGGAFMPEQPVNGVAPAAVSVFDETLRLEANRFGAPGLFTNPDSDYWFWAYVTSGTAGDNTNLTVVVPGVANEEATARLVVHLFGATSGGMENEHHARISLNGTVIGEASWSGIAARDVECVFNQALLVSGTNIVRVVALRDAGMPSLTMYVNSLDLSYRRRAEAINGQLMLPAGDLSPIILGGFSGSSIEILDVRDPLQPAVLTGVTAEGGKAGFEPAAPGGVYAAYDPAKALTPKFVVADVASNWRNAGNAAEYVVIVPADLAAAVQPLVNQRAAQGLSTARVLLEDVYDEFNDGLAEPVALRNFLAWAHDTWQGPPAYVLLAGEGTYDYKGYLPATDNKIPVMMRSTPHGIFASDDWFADVDEDGTADLAIGRLPAATSAELTTMVNKIIAFEGSQGGAWRQQFLLLADNPDVAGDFPVTADSVAIITPRDYEPVPNYLATNTSAAVTAARNALLAKLRTGLAHMTYFGHGAWDRLAAEGLLKNSDVSSLTNSTRLPVMVFLTCTAGLFSNPGMDCLAEQLLLNSRGGAGAVWAPSGLSYNDKALDLAVAYYRAVFVYNRTRLGDACLQAYRQYAEVRGAGDYLPTMYNLLGDPGMRLTGTAAINNSPTFDTWRNQFFTATEQANPTIGQSQSDMDGDGSVNLLEYAFGWNPRVADARGLGLGAMPFRNDPNYLWVFEYQRRRRVSDVNYLVDFANNLRAPSWANALQSLIETEVTDDGNGLTETVRLKIRRQHLEDLEHLFLRLRVGR